MNWDKDDMHKAIDAVTYSRPDNSVMVNVMALAEAFVYMVKIQGKSKTEAVDLFNHLWADMQVTVKIPGEPDRVA